MTTSLSLIGYASHIAANDPGCAEGPVQLQNHALEQQLSELQIPSYWQAMLVSRSGSKKIACSALIPNWLISLMI